MRENRHRTMIGETTTALPGWAERTRTRERHFLEAVEISAKFSLVRRTLWDLRHFARELQQRSSK
jgi:hypothetical protein